MSAITHCITNSTHVYNFHFYSPADGTITESGVNIKCVMAGNLVTWLCGEEGSIKQVNGSSLNDSMSDTLMTNSTSTVESGGYTGDPMLYILVVLLFYATSITLFMVKYIKKQSEEQQCDNDYNTFVRMEGFDQKLMEAKNVAAMRLKELACGKKKPVTVTVPQDKMQDKVLDKVQDNVLTSAV